MPGVYSAQRYSPDHWRYHLLRPLLESPRLFLRLALRIALAFAIRRCSLLETYHLFLRTALRIPLLDTCLRKRLSKSSCDSPGLKYTVTTYTSFAITSNFSTLLLKNDRKTRHIFRLLDLLGGAAESVAHPRPECRHTILL